MRTYDTVAPTVTSLTANRESPFKDSTMTVTIQFSEAVKDFTVEDLAPVNGTLSGFTKVSDSEYTVVVTPSGQGDAGLSLKSKSFTDLAGNQYVGTDDRIVRTYDTVAPTVTLEGATTPFKASDAPWVVTAKFSEPAFGVAAGDLELVNGTATITLKSGNDGDKVFKFNVNPTSDGNVQVRFKASAATDAAGNANTAASNPLTRTYDTTPPTVTSFKVDPNGYFNYAEDEENYADNGKRLYVRAPSSSVVVSFSEPMDESSLKGVLTFSNAAENIENENEPFDPSPVAGSENTWKWTFQPKSEGPITVEVSTKATDIAGNPIASAVRYNDTLLVYDTTDPTLSLSGTPANGATTSAGDFAITITPTEDNASAGMALAWSVSGGGAEVASGTGSGAGPWVAQGSGLGEGEYIFSATATDAAGNVSEAATCEWSVTRAKPTAYITAPEQQPVKGKEAKFTVEFTQGGNEVEVFDLSLADFTALGGRVTDLKAETPARYVATLSVEEPSTTVGLALAAHVCTNALGIGNAAAGPATCEVDYTLPAIGPLSVAPLRAKTGAPVTYSFDVVDVNLDTVAVANQRVEAAAPSAAGVVHCTFATTATSAATFTISATDTVGNSTTNSVTSPLVVDTTPPTVTWSGLPDDNSTNDATIVIATLESVSDGEDDPDPNVRVAWSLLRLAGNGEEETVASGEDWATTASPVRAQATLGAGDWAFDWQAWDTAGNTSAVERVSWTVADVPDPVVGKIVAGVTNAVFEVPGDASGEDVAKWLRLNNVDIEAVDVSYDSNSATTTVSVATSPLAPERATVELVVPAGAMGNTNEWSATASVAALPPAPRLEYVGRRLDDPNILEWKLWNVDSMPDAGAFAVTDAKTGAPHTYQGRDPVAQPWTTNGYVCATVTNIFSTSGENSYTIQVFEMGKDSRAAMEAFVWDSRRATDKNSSWMADAFVDHRLVYTDPASGTAITNVGPAEVNLAMKAYGGIFKATTKKQNNAVVPGSRLNVRWGPDEADPTTIYTELFNAADGVLQTRTRGVTDRKDQGATDIIPSVERIYRDQNMATVALHGFGKDEQGNAKFNDKPIWDSHKAMVIRRIEWVCVPSNVVTKVGIAAITNATITIRKHDGTPDGQWITNVTFNVTQQTAKGYKYSVEIPDVVGGRVLLSDIKTTKRVTGTSQDAYEVMLSEFGMFGAPVALESQDGPQVVSIQRSDTLASLPTNAVFTVAFDRPVRYAGNEDGLTPNADEAAFNTNALLFAVANGSELDVTRAAFTATRLSDTEVEVVVTGLSGEGKAALVVDEGFAKTPGGVANAAATGPVESFDAVVPTVTAEKISDADRATAAATGILRFGLDLSEPATGLDLSSFTLTGGTASAELLSIANGTETGTNYVVTARVTGGSAGNTVSLALRPTVLTDLAGNTNTVSATWEDAYTLTNATTAAVPTVTLAAGNGGTVSPLGSVAAVGGALSATATPNAGYYLSGWTGATPASATTNAATGAVTASFTDLADGTTITANFSQIGTVTVKASVSESGGKVSPASASIAKGGSASVLVEASAGYRIASVTTNNTPITAAASNTTYLVSLANLQSAVDVVAAFVSIPNVTITIRDGEAEETREDVVWNADWLHAFTAPEGKVIASITATDATASISFPSAVGATNYTAQLFGVVEATTVAVTYRDNEEPPEPSGFEMTNLRWTGFDPATGVATFTATAEGEAPETVSVLWVSSPGSATTNTAENCELSLVGGEGSVSGVPTDENALFLVGLEITEE